MICTEDFYSSFFSDGTDGYVDDGREIFDEDLDEKPAASGTIQYGKMINSQNTRHASRNAFYYETKMP